MPKWLRGIYNAAANFNMRNAVQSANGRTMGRNNKQLSEERNQSDESVIANKSNVTATPYPCASCTCARTSSRNGYRTPCKCTTATEDRSVIIGNDVIPTPADYIERDYSEYANYTVSASREDPSTGVRVSDESRDFKQADADSASSVERRTGIPTGVTV